MADDGGNGDWRERVLRGMGTKRPYDIIEPISWQGTRPRPREWLVRDWIPMRNVTMLGGDGGLGKSLLAMQLMTVAATSGTWLGLDVLPCKAFGYFCEDEPDELHRRMEAITTHYNIEMGDLEDVQIVSRVGGDNSFMDFDGPWGPGEVTDILSNVMNDCLQFGAQCIVLDSLHDIFAGNENNRMQARQFIGELRVLATECDAAVVLTAHPSLSGRNTGTGESGSTAWNNAVRSRLYLKKPEPPTNGFGNGHEPPEDIGPPVKGRILENMKANYSASGSRIKLDWEDGVYVAEQAPSTVERRATQDKAQRVFLKMLDHFKNLNRNVTDNSYSRNYAPAEFMKSDLREGVTRRDFERAMHTLFDRGVISIEEYGPQSKRNRRISFEPKARDMFM